MSEHQKLRAAFEVEAETAGPEPKRLVHAAGLGKLPVDGVGGNVERRAMRRARATSRCLWDWCRNPSGPKGMLRLTCDSAAKWMIASGPLHRATFDRGASQKSPHTNWYRLSKPTMRTFSRLPAQVSACREIDHARNCNFAHPHPNDRW